MLGHGFNSEVAQNKTMAASFDNNLSNDNSKPQQISSNQSTSSDNSLGKKVNTKQSLCFSGIQHCTFVKYELTGVLKCIK